MLLLLAGPAVYWRLSVAARQAQPSGTAQASALRSSRHAVLLALAAQALGLSLTAGGVWWQSRNLDSFSQSRFEQGAERIQAEVVRRLNQSIYGLKGARGAMAANSDFKRSAFRAYVESRDLATEFPGIRGFGLLQRVQRSALERFIASERADGAPDFNVRSSGQASDLFVVRFVEPLASNRAALGFDMGQESGRRAAVEYAVDTGEPTLLAGISLLQDSHHTPALMLLLPVYRWCL
jgi:CHASE1-domain containing sensor protein